VKEYWLANPEAKSLQIFLMEDDEYQEFETLEEKEEIITSKLSPNLKVKKTYVFEYQQNKDV